jgi:hypothetical protein
LQKTITFVTPKSVSMEIDGEVFTKNLSNVTMKNVEIDLKDEFIKVSLKNKAETLLLHDPAIPNPLGFLNTKKGMVLPPDMSARMKNALTTLIEEINLLMTERL